MPISRAHVPTASGARYMTQLCKHWSHKLDVELQRDDGAHRASMPTVRAFSTRCADGLELEVTAATEEQLARTQETVINHLKRFAFREELGEVSWRRLE